MSVWRCRVCEGVNQGGRVCATCGAEVPVGEPLRAAVRTRLPSTTPPAPAPVPPLPTRRELYGYPTPEEYAELDPYEMEEPESGYSFTPLPGGCLMTFAPGRGRGF